MIVWALVAMALAQFPPIFKATAWIEAIYYVVAGLGWVLPAMPLIRWMLTAEKSGRIDAAEAVPHRGGGARQQHLARSAAAGARR